MSAYDRSIALQLQGGGSTTFSPAVERPTLFNLCIQVCVRHHINVGQAFASGARRPIPRFRPGIDDLRAPPATEPAFPKLRKGKGTEQDLKVMPSRQHHPIAASNYVRHNIKTVGSDTVKQYDSKKKKQSLPKIDQCDVCFSEDIRGFELACDHSQCVDCMTRHFRVALNDRSLLPLKCCEIPIDESISEIVLRPAEVALLTSRTQEVTATNKMYCPRCSRFINLDLVDRDPGAPSTLLCECRQLLCITCKTASHAGVSCAQNRQAATANDAALLQLAESEGWKQCPKCSIMIELSIGCYHMTCSNCTHEFCFRCGSEWDVGNASCSTGVCPVWEERRLLEAAEARVNAQEAAAAQAHRQPNRRVAAPAPAVFVDPVDRAQRVQNEMRALRGNEGCFHDWTRTSMTGRSCERCGYDLWVYGMVCRAGCRSTVCYTCAHHRIPRWGWR